MKNRKGRMRTCSQVHFPPSRKLKYNRKIHPEARLRFCRRLVDTICKFHLYAISHSETWQQLIGLDFENRIIFQFTQRYFKVGPITAFLGKIITQLSQSGLGVSSFFPTIPDQSPERASAMLTQCLQPYWWFISCHF